MSSDHSTAGSLEQNITLMMKTVNIVCLFVCLFVYLYYPIVSYKMYRATIQ